MCKYDQNRANIPFYRIFATHVNLCFLGANVCLIFTFTVIVELFQMCTSFSHLQTVYKYCVNAVLTIFALKANVVQT